MSKKDRDTQKPIKTDVILVIKGAGDQNIDTTLDLFLMGFFPAMRKYDREAKLRIGRESTIFDDYVYQPFYKGENQKIAEITTTDGKGEPRRIWIKESYWEPLIKEPGALKALFSEWDLTSFSLRNVIEDLLYPWHNGKRYGADGEETKDLNARKHSPFTYWLFFFIAHLLVLTFLGLTGVWVRSPINTGLEITRVSMLLMQFWHYFLAAAGVALVASLGPAVISARSHTAKERLPGLGSWVLWAMVVALLFQPGSYTAVLLMYLVVGVVVILLARRGAWSMRPNWYTDSPVKYHLDKDNKYIDQRPSHLARGTQFAYRLFTVLGIPVAILTLLLSKGFRILNLFGDLGTKIDDVISGFVNRFLGDVTAYALDPVQASIVQNVVEEDIKTFVDLTQSEDETEPVVDVVHLFAHSQGTPIAYEVYIHLLDVRYRKKVRNLLTIGSVLNLHNLVNGVLDETQWSRFPPEEYPPQNTVNRGFKWINFWNFTDPITQFVGLEAYRYAALKMNKDGDIIYHQDGTPTLTFHKISPFSIKTKDSILKNHMEYWTNIDEIHYPFIKHILKPDPNKWLPDEWVSPSLRRRQEEVTWNEDEYEQSAYERNLRTHRILFVGVWLLLLGGIIALIYFGWFDFTNWLSAIFGTIGIGIGTIIGWLTLLLAPESLEWLKQVRDVLEMGYQDQRLVNGIGFLLVIWATLPSLYSFLRSITTTSDP